MFYLFTLYFEIVIDIMYILWTCSVIFNWVACERYGYSNKKQNYVFEHNNTLSYNYYCHNKKVNKMGGKVFKPKIDVYSHQI